MERVVLGIDPGFSFTGFGVLKIAQSKTMLVDCGYLRLSPKDHLSQRIGTFFDCFTKKIAQHQVTHIAIETPFLGKNVQTFLKLGYLRGVLYLLANQNKLGIQEFAPREVKNMLTGFGGASKEQVARMVFMLFPQLQQLKEAERNDLTDAVAITLCGLWHGNVVMPGSVAQR
jgi:crossover junction endodeoxyribonuclease RuvC